jgi:hypothetical protein
MSKKILVVLPSPLLARNFLRSGTLDLLRKTDGLRIVVVSPNPDDRQVVEAAGARWESYFHPRRSATGTGPIGAVTRWSRYLRYLAGLVLHMALTYRINIMSGFRGFPGRLKQSRALRWRYLREGLPMSRLFGFPFPRSAFLYRSLYRLYFSRWQGFAPVNRLIADVAPDLVVLSAIQMHMVTPYALAAMNASVQVLGINGSWDQPTTKGPVVPGVSRIVTQNDIVRDELVRYHGIDASRIVTIGWLQMDAFVRPPEGDRQSLQDRLGIPSGCRYILFAANAPRLGLHEPALLREVASRMQSGALGENVVVVCRCHPQDRNWKDRWGWAQTMRNVVVEPPDLGPLDHLASIIRHASVVVASAGSINLDAVALDVPTIGIAWEDESKPYWDRPARAYDLEHLADLRVSEGIAFARNIPELLTACARYLDDPAADAGGRKRLRERYLYRLDGMAARRLVDCIETMLA